MGPLPECAGETWLVIVLVAEEVGDLPVGASGLLERVGGREAGQPEHTGHFGLSGKRKEVGW